MSTDGPSGGPPEEPDAPRPSGDPVKPLPGPVAFVGMGSTVAGCVAVVVLMVLLG